MIRTRQLRASLELDKIQFPKLFKTKTHCICLGTVIHILCLGLVLNTVQPKRRRALILILCCAWNWHFTFRHFFWSSVIGIICQKDPGFLYSILQNNADMVLLLMGSLKCFLISSEIAPCNIFYVHRAQCLYDHSRELYQHEC